MTKTNSTTTITIEEARRQAEEAQRIHREAEQAAAEKAREEKRAVERQAERARFEAECKKRQAAVDMIVEKFNAAGLSVEAIAGDVEKGVVPHIKSHCGVMVGLEVTYRGSSKWRCGTPVLNLAVGERYQGHDVHRYPPKADGTYSYDKAIAYAKQCIAGDEYQAKLAKEKAAALQAAANIAAPLQSKYGSEIVTGEYTSAYHDARGRYRSNIITASKGKVFVNLHRMELTPERADELLHLMTVHAFIKKGK